MLLLVYTFTFFALFFSLLFFSFVFIKSALSSKVQVLYYFEFLEKWFLIKIFISLLPCLFFSNFRRKRWILRPLFSEIISFGDLSETWLIIWCWCDGGNKLNWIRRLLTWWIFGGFDKVNVWNLIGVGVNFLNFGVILENVILNMQE